MDSSSGLANQNSSIKAMSVKPEHHKAVHWIADAIKNKGGLHRATHTPAGEKIPESKIKSAENKGGKIGKETHLAETLSHFKK
jgi:hypothetical protein